MKLTAALAAIGLLLASPVLAQAYHYDNGYTRQDGTVVQPHYQTNPDGNRANNWSSQGNVNPFTGQAGTRNPYAPYGR